MRVYVCRPSYEDKSQQKKIVCWPRVMFFYVDADAPVLLLASGCRTFLNLLVRAAVEMDDAGMR